MGVYIADPWDSLSPGYSGAPPGWSLFGSSTVSASDGAFPGHNFGSGFFSPLQTPLFACPNTPTNNPEVQAMFGAQINGAFQFQVSLVNITGDPEPVFELILESDWSLSLKTGSTVFLINETTTQPANTGLNAGLYFYQNTWYYFVLLIDVRPGTGAGGGYLEVEATLQVDGNLIIPASKNFAIPLSNFPTSMGSLLGQFDQCNWLGNTGFNTQVQISDWGAPYPDPTAPFARIPQAVIEPGVIPVTANVRIPQAVIEEGQLNVPFVRIPQMVIELATPFVSQQQGPFPEYIKRRNLFANN